MNAVVHTVTSVIYGYGKYGTEDQQEQRKNDARTWDPIALEKHIQMEVLEYIVQLVNIIHPIDVLLIEFDGPIPMGKIDQQKLRRYRTAVDRPADMPFDSNCITPGTQFMFNLCEFLRDAFDDTEFYLSLAVKDVIFSSHLVPGEGEHKIFDYFRSGKIAGAGTEKNGFNVIYGMDADLILISLLSDMKRIMIARDSIQVHVNDLKGNIVLCQDITARDNPNDIHIDELRNAIIYDLNAEERDEAGRKLAISDFSVMISLLGNDFIPHPPATKNMSTFIFYLIQIYRQLGSTITYYQENGDLAINWATMYTLISGVQKFEGELLKSNAEQEIVKREKKIMAFPSRMLDVALSNGEYNEVLFRSAWYTNEFSYPPAPRHMGVDTTSNASRISSMCYQFMRGIAWVLRYYTKGQNSVTWMWSYPFYHSPLFYDLVFFLNGISSASAEEITKMMDVSPAPGEERFTPIHQLLAVIPPRSVNLLPPELVQFYMPGSPLKDLVPESIIIELDGIDSPKYAYNGLPIVPKPDYVRIMDAVFNMGFNAKRWTIWNPEEDFLKTLPNDLRLARYRVSQHEAEIAALLEEGREARHRAWLKKRLGDTSSTVVVKGGYVKENVPSKREFAPTPFSTPENTPVLSVPGYVPTPGAFVKSTRGRRGGLSYNTYTPPPLPSQKPASVTPSATPYGASSTAPFGAPSTAPFGAPSSTPFGTPISTTYMTLAPAATPAATPATTPYTTSGSGRGRGGSSFGGRGGYSGGRGSSFGGRGGGYSGGRGGRGRGSMPSMQETGSSAVSFTDVKPRTMGGTPISTTKANLM